MACIFGVWVFCGGCCGDISCVRRGDGWGGWSDGGLKRFLFFGGREEEIIKEGGSGFGCASKEGIVGVGEEIIEIFGDITKVKRSKCRSGAVVLFWGKSRLGLWILILTHESVFSKRMSERGGSRGKVDIQKVQSLGKIFRATESDIKKDPVCPCSFSRGDTEILEG